MKSKQVSAKLRNNNWLEERLAYIWRQYFTDVKVANRVSIRFSRPSKFRFGSITLVKQNFWGRGESKILINGNFARRSVPAGVVDYTIAHELVHYAHGFSSNLPRLHRYPHQGGIIDRELKERGMAKTILIYKKWLKDYHATIRSKT